MIFLFHVVKKRVRKNARKRVYVSFSVFLYVCSCSFSWCRQITAVCVRGSKGAEFVRRKKKKKKKCKEVKRCCRPNACDITLLEPLRPTTNTLRTSSIRL